MGLDSRAAVTSVARLVIAATALAMLIAAAACEDASEPTAPPSSSPRAAASTPCPSSDADRNVPADGRGDPTRHLDTRAGTDGHRHAPAIPDADAETHSRTHGGSASCHLDACSDCDSDT